MKKERPLHKRDGSGFNAAKFSQYLSKHYDPNVIPIMMGLVLQFADGTNRLEMALDISLNFLSHGQKRILINALLATLSPNELRNILSGSMSISEIEDWIATMREKQTIESLRYMNEQSE